MQPARRDRPRMLRCASARCGLRRRPPRPPAGGTDPAAPPGGARGRSRSAGPSSESPLQMRSSWWPQIRTAGPRHNRGGSTGVKVASYQPYADMLPTTTARPSSESPLQMRSSWWPRPQLRGRFGAAAPGPSAGSSRRRRLGGGCETRWRCTCPCHPAATGRSSSSSSSSSGTGEQHLGEAARDDDLEDGRRRSPRPPTTEAPSCATRPGPRARGDVRLPRAPDMPPPWACSQQRRNEAGGRSTCVRRNSLPS